MTNLKTHRDLDCWQRAINLVTVIYKTTAKYPKEEIYGITSQIRRSAVSVPSNIAEGASRSSKNEFSHFLSISLGSLSELETQIIISQNLFFIENNESELILDEISIIKRMLIGLRNNINGK